MKQVEINFEPKKLHGEYPLQYVLMRIGKGELGNSFWHVNTIWEGYNSNGYPIRPIESRLAIYHDAYNVSDIRKAIDASINDTAINRTHYLMVKFDYDIVKTMDGFIE